MRTTHLNDDDDDYVHLMTANGARAKRQLRGTRITINMGHPLNIINTESGANSLHLTAASRTESDPQRHTNASRCRREHHFRPQLIRRFFSFLLFFFCLFWLRFVCSFSFFSFRAVFVECCRETKRKFCCNINHKRINAYASNRN